MKFINSVTGSELLLLDVSISTQPEVERKNGAYKTPYADVNTICCGISSQHFKYILSKNGAQPSCHA